MVCLTLLGKMGTLLTIDEEKTVNNAIRIFAKKLVTATNTNVEEEIVAVEEVVVEEEVVAVEGEVVVEEEVAVEEEVVVVEEVIYGTNSLNSYVSTTYLKIPYDSSDLSTISIDISGKYIDANNDIYDDIEKCMFDIIKKYESERTGAPLYKYILNMQIPLYIEE